MFELILFSNSYFILMKRNLLLGFLFFSAAVSAQTEKEIGVVISPANINIDSPFDEYQSIYTVNYGVRGAITWDRVSVNVGILHLTQGGKNDNLLTRPSDPINSVLYFRAKGISVPIGVDYNLINKEATKVFAGIGLHTAYICCQNSTIENNGTVTKLPKSNNNQFESLYFGMNFGIGVKQQLNDKWNLLLRPNFIYQLRNSTTTIGLTEFKDPKFRSFAMDFGLMYRLK